MKFKIFTETTANLTKDIIDRYNIGVIPLSFIKDGEIYNSQIIGTNEYYQDFYEMLRNRDNLTTTCANTSEFLQVFEPILQKGIDILYIGFSSGLSATFSCGVEAIEILTKKYPERKIMALDSLNASMGQGLYVYSACQMAEEGKEMEEVYDALNNSKQNLNSIFTVKTLAYLARGGRISKMSYAIGTVVDIKPIMYVNKNGKLVAFSKVFGRKRSIMAIADKVSKTIIDSEKQTVFISHGDCIEDAKLLEKLIREKTSVTNFIYNYIDPVIGVHSGPDTLAVFYYGLNREETVLASNENLAKNQETAISKTI